LNAYLELGLPPYTVTLRSLWVENPKAISLKRSQSGCSVSK
jgi:hypothetical protein